MYTFKSNCADRKVLVERISELTGEKLQYTRAPHYSYEGSGFTITREGDLEVDETADRSVIKN